MQRGVVVSGECLRDAPDDPGERGSLWQIVCAGVAGPWREGDEVTFVFVDNFFDEDDIRNGLDPTGEYAIYDFVCWRDGAVVHTVTVIVTVTEPVSAEAIRDEATARLEVPAPKPETSPPLARQAFVGIQTWLWMDPSDWVPMEVSETRGIM